MYKPFYQILSRRKEKNTGMVNLSFDAKKKFATVLTVGGKTPLHVFNVLLFNNVKFSPKHRRIKFVISSKKLFLIVLIMCRNPNRAQFVVPELAII